jgi:uncharacterized protein YndB with AHSA1/START domain
VLGGVAPRVAGRDRVNVARKEAAAARRILDGPVEIADGLRMARRHHLYRTTEGLVSATTFDVRFTVEASPAEVWPVFRDLNAWHGAVNHYSGLVADLEGSDFHLSSAAEPGKWRVTYHVVRVIPEHLLAFSGPLPYDARSPDGPGERIGGMNVFMLNERDGRTDVHCFLEQGRRDREWTDEEALAPWRQQAQGSQDKWRDHFVPTLKRLVAKRGA